VGQGEQDDCATGGNGDYVDGCADDGRTAGFNTGSCNLNGTDN
jgi:hypothetical protein